MLYSVTEKTGLTKIREPFDVDPPNEPGNHISDIEWKVAQNLAFIKLLNGPYHNAIRKAAQYLYSKQKKTAEYITQWDEGATVWEYKGERLIVLNSDWLEHDLPRTYIAEVAVLYQGKTARPEPTREEIRVKDFARLKRDNAFVWAFVNDEIVQKQPANGPLIDRAIRAGFLIHDQAVRKQLNRRGKNQGVVAYVTPLEDKQKGDYIVTRGAEFNCTCQDWIKGARVHVEHGLGRVAAKCFGEGPEGYAPYKQGVGVCCEHVLAIILMVKVDAHIIEATDELMERKMHQGN